MSRSSKSKSTSKKKERGTWLSAWLILIALHSILYAFLILYLRGQSNEDSPVWMAIVVFVLSIVDVVAVIAIWNWKKWGLQLYAVTTVVAIAVGLMLTGTQLIVFHAILPLAILGYLIKDKWAQFE